MKILNKKGFTLLELLVVIAIIAILVAIIIVVLSGPRAQARDSERIQNVRQIRNALELYYADHGSYPPGINGSGLAHNTPNNNALVASAQMAQVFRSTRTTTDTTLYNADGGEYGDYSATDGTLRRDTTGTIDTTPINNDGSTLRVNEPTCQTGQTVNTADSSSVLVTEGYLSADLCDPRGIPYLYTTFNENQGYHLGAVMETNPEVLDSDADFDSTGLSTNGFDGSQPKIFDVTNVKQLY